MERTLTHDFIGAPALGLSGGGRELATNHPGVRSNGLADRLRCTTTSGDEKNAVAVAWGASLAGKRGVVTMKNVGLNDAADAYLNALALGVNGGLVLVVFDDVDLDHSQVRMDSRPYASFYGGLWLEPSSATRAYEIGRQALAVSEQLSTPVVIRVTNILALRDPAPPRHPRISGEKMFTRDPERWVIHPLNAARQEEALSGRNQRIQQWVDAQPFRWTEPAPGGPVHLSVGGRLFRRGAPLVSTEVETFPLPGPLLRKLREVDLPLVVHERGGPFIADRIRAALCAREVQHAVKPPVRTHREYHNRDQHEPLFSAIRSLPARFVSGDLGGFTMDPDRTIDACLCYGCSVGVATGFALADPAAEVVCVTGDGAFLHSGKAAVAEAAERGTRLTIIILDNGGCQGTGGQRIPGDLSFSDPRVEVMQADFSAMSADDHRWLLRRQGESRAPIRVVKMKIGF